MLTLPDLEFFSVVARSRSLAAAARALDVTPSAVTQRLQDLERRLGVRLVTRSGHRISLTDEGEWLLSRGRAISDDIAVLVDSFAARRGHVVGHLRVLAPLGFGRRFVAPIVAAFASEHPDLIVTLMLSDRPGAVSGDSWDVAIHVGDPREGTFTTHTVAPNGRLLCASPSYLTRWGQPNSPTELARHRCIALRENDEDVTLWRLRAMKRAVQNVRVSPVMSSNDGDVVRDWSIAGLGIIARSEWSVADDLRQGALIRVLPEYQLPDADIVAQVAARGSSLARTTRFVEALKQAMTPVPWRTASAAPGTGT